MNSADKASNKTGSNSSFAIGSEKGAGEKTKGERIVTNTESGVPKAQELPSLQISPKNFSQRVIEYEKFLEKYKSFLKWNMPLIGDASMCEFVEKMEAMENSITEHINRMKEHTETKLSKIRESGGKKHRLFLGEGNLSFTLAFIKKHPETVPYITTTIYEPLGGRKLANGYVENEQEIIRLGVSKSAILHEVDAQTLDEDKRFGGKEYGHIHWNFPFDKWETTTEAVDKFFKSARKKLSHKGHIHMTLVSKKVELSNSGENDYQGKVYKTVDAALKNGYKLIKKHRMRLVSKTDKRYPGYMPTLAMPDKEMDPSLQEKGREYVFKIVDKKNEFIAKRITLNRLSYLPEEQGKPKKGQLIEILSNIKKKAVNQLESGNLSNDEIAKKVTALDYLIDILVKNNGTATWPASSMASLLQKYASEMGNVEPLVKLFLEHANVLEIGDGGVKFFKDLENTLLVGDLPKYWDCDTDDDSSDEETLPIEKESNQEDEDTASSSVSTSSTSKIKKDDDSE